MPREFEIKYRLTEGAFAALSGQYGPFRQIRMETTYFDTPDQALSARKWTLRRRYENGVSVCTLKTPSPDGGRGEWEVTCPDIADALAPLVALGAPEELLHLGADLRPLCAARFVRLAADLHYGESRLELALDRGSLLGGNREAPIFEVEAELKAGQDAGAQKQIQTGPGSGPGRKVTNHVQPNRLRPGGQPLLHPGAF